MTALIFFIFAGIAVFCGISLVVQTHPIASALSLIGVMGSLAILYLQLGGEFIFKYDDVRAAQSPETAILDFCQSTYEAGAKLAYVARSAISSDAWVDHIDIDGLMLTTASAPKSTLMRFWRKLFVCVKRRYRRRATIICKKKPIRAIT